MAQQTVTRLLLPLVMLLAVVWPYGLVSASGPYFEDGYLGLTQAQLHEKLGMPQAVRDRKSALRVFTYYPIGDWDQYFKKVVSPENGEDVYTFKRGGVEVRYSFSFTFDPNDQSESRPLFVRLVDVEFSPPVPLLRIPELVPEFRPPDDPSAPVFRSNIMLLFFKGAPSSEARFIVREKGKESLDWSLAFQMFALQGLPDPLTSKAVIDRMEISTQSLPLVKMRQRNTHDPILNPYSKEFAQQAPPAPVTKKIPVPKYAD
ncbi:MAG TPA: hypothetical protein VFQ34_05910 [Nitrospiraceae bacterium]|jgi:hypothetical protein|nr:hypothetical protein [Nitrospiraceae bacterium]